MIGPDYDNPRPIRFFVEGYGYKVLGLIPSHTHLFGTADGKPFHLLGTDKFGRDILSRGIVGLPHFTCHCPHHCSFHHHCRHVCWHHVWLSGWASFDAWTQRVVEVILAFPQLPLYLTLTTLIPVTAPTSVFLTFVVLVMSFLGWAQSCVEIRGKTLGPCPH